MGGDWDEDGRDMAYDQVGDSRLSKDKLLGLMTIPMSDFELLFSLEMFVGLSIGFVNVNIDVPTNVVVNGELVRSLSLS